MFNRRIAVALVVMMMTTLFVASASASEGANPYLQINNRYISITETEKPQVVLQFGNRGQETFEGAGILCLTTGEVFITQQAFPNAFPNFSVAPVGVTAPEQAISFPSAFSFLGAENDFIDIPRGQNFNVAFNIEIRRDDNPETNGGQVLCALVSGPAVVDAALTLGLDATNLTDEAVVDLIASVGVLAAAEVNVR